jgi:hypothetical protein
LNANWSPSVLRRTDDGHELDSGAALFLQADADLVVDLFLWGAQARRDHTPIRPQPSGAGTKRVAHLANAGVRTLPLDLTVEIERGWRAQTRPNPPRPMLRVTVGALDRSGPPRID